MSENQTEVIPGKDSVIPEIENIESLPTHPTNDSYVRCYVDVYIMQEDDEEETERMKNLGFTTEEAPREVFKIAKQFYTPDIVSVGEHITIEGKIRDNCSVIHLVTGVSYVVYVPFKELSDIVQNVSMLYDFTK